METNQEAALSLLVALGTASCPLPGEFALSPLLTWEGRGTRHGAGCTEWWPGPPQTGEKRASGTVGPPGHLHTGLGVLSHSPEAEGEEAQGVHTCTSHTGTAIHLPGCHPDSLCTSVVSCQRAVLNMESHLCVQPVPLLSCSLPTLSYFISVPHSHMQSGLASPLGT